MELDNLKKIWAEKDEDFENDSKELVFSPNRKSKHPVERIRRKLIYENLLNIVGAIALLIYMYWTKNNLPAYITISFISILVVTFSYVGWKLQQINRLINYAGETKDFLIKFNNAIKRYVNLLTWSAFLLLPAAFYIGFAFGINIEIQRNILEVLAEPKIFIVTLIICISTTTIGFLLIKLLYRKVYGKHIIEIESIISELNINSQESNSI